MRGLAPTSKYAHARIRFLSLFFFLASFLVTFQQERIHWFCLCVLAKLSIKVVFRKRS